MNEEPAVRCHSNMKDGFQHLQQHVATSAFDSDAIAEASECDPDTRDAVLSEITAWIVQATLPILWLNGAAGAGKSAIARSIVQYCLAHNIPISRFFFFRTDPTRNNTQTLVATLIVQLIQAVPELNSIITPLIEADPLIFTKSLKTQFEYVIFNPLRQLRAMSSSQNTLVLLVDGIDECNIHDDQMDLIRILSRFASSGDYPAIVLFASRTESHLNATFREPEIAADLIVIPLDKSSADNDIRRFVQKSFERIRATHEFNYTLEPGWPSYNDVEAIVAKSSGQFIFSAVSLKFIATPGESPAAQLKIILGLRPSQASNPFAQLDALYKHIFSIAAQKRVTLLVLAWALFSVSGSLQISQCGYMLSKPPEDIYFALASLTSVISFTHGPDGKIKFLHASLPDFLCNQSRSEEYYMDRASWCNTIARFSMSNKMDFPLEDRSFRVRYLEYESEYISQANGIRSIRRSLFSLCVDHMLIRVHNDAWLLAYLGCMLNSCGNTISGGPCRYLIRGMLTSKALRRIFLVILLLLYFILRPIFYFIPLRDIQ